MAATVLLVEDERKLRELVRSYLERAGFTALSTGSGAEAITLAASAAPDLVVLDLGLPDVPGETVAREVRASRPVPIVMLTAKAAEEDRIAGLELGADDYVTKPFSPRELVLRVQAILRRGLPSAGPRAVSYGGGILLIDESRREVSVREARADLTPTEWGLLGALATVPGRVYSRYELINRVRGYEFEGYERTVDSHVKNLRRKIEDDPGRPRIVQTVMGAATGWASPAMTDGGGPRSVPASRRTALGLRLALAFISVALAAVALVAGLTAGFAAADVSALATRQHAELTNAIAVAAGAAWDKNDSWAAADLAPVLDLAGQAGADVQIRDRQGSVVTSSPGFITQSSGPATGAPIVVRGERAGQADVRFTGSGLASADHALRTALLRAIFGAAGLAALLALLTGLAMARRITRPVERIIAVTRGDGQRAARRPGRADHRPG